MGLKETGQILYHRLPGIGEGKSLLGKETRFFLSRIELHGNNVEALFNLNTDPFKLGPAHKAFLSLFIQESIAINLVNIPALDENLPLNLSAEYPQLWEELDGHFDKNHARIEETYGLSTLRNVTIEKFRQQQHPLIEIAEKLSSFYFANRETQPNQREKQDNINECTELVEIYKELLSNSDLSRYVRIPWIKNLKHMAGKDPTLAKIFSIVALSLLVGGSLETLHLTKQDEEKNSSKPAMVFPATLPPPNGDVVLKETPAPTPTLEPTATQVTSDGYYLDGNVLEKQSTNDEHIKNTQRILKGLFSTIMNELGYEVGELKGFNDKLHRGIVKNEGIIMRSYPVENAFVINELSAPELPTGIIYAGKLVIWIAEIDIKRGNFEDKFGLLEPNPETHNVPQYIRLAQKLPGDKDWQWFVEPKT